MSKENGTHPPSSTIGQQLMIAAFTLGLVSVVSLAFMVTAASLVLFGPALTFGVLVAGVILGAGAVLALMGMSATERDA